jgi:hypothetical protein
MMVVTSPIMEDVWMSESLGDSARSSLHAGRVPSLMAHRAQRRDGASY